MYLTDWSENHKYIKLNNASGTVTINDGVIAETTTTTDVRYLVTTCSPGTTFFITCAGSSGSRPYAFINSSGTILEVAPAYATYSNKRITAPANTMYLVVNDITLTGTVLVGTLRKYHSIDFTDISTGVTMNTFGDWRLVATTRPVINPPKPKTKYVDIPGGDGQIDLTDALAGRPAYSNREGSIEFLVMNNYAPEGPSDYNWVNAYSSVMQFLHGKRVRAVLEDDPDYYYEGRVTVDSWNTNKDWSTISISYSFYPYRYLSDPTTLFTLENGTIAINNGEDFPSNNGARTVGDPIQFSKGDVISIKQIPGMLGPPDHLDSVLYYGPTASSTYPGQAEGLVHTYANGGNEYIIQKDGYYRFVLTAWDSGTITEEMRAVMMQEVQIKKGGIL